MNKKRRGKNEWSELAVLLNQKNSSEVRITRVTVEYVNFGTEYARGVKKKKGK